MLSEFYAEELKAKVAKQFALKNTSEEFNNSISCGWSKASFLLIFSPTMFDSKKTYYNFGAQMRKINIIPSIIEVVVINCGL